MTKIVLNDILKFDELPFLTY